MHIQIQIIQKAERNISLEEEFKLLRERLQSILNTVSMFFWPLSNKDHMRQEKEKRRRRNIPLDNCIQDLFK